MIKIKNIPITFVESYSKEQLITIMNSYKLINYIDKNLSNKDVDIKSIKIYKVNFFGKNIGFIYLESDIYVNSEKVPGISFLRGDSVAILLILNTINAQKFTIIIEQYRSSIGEFTNEIPAGMIDEEGNVVSTAIKEIEEEVGNLNIKEKDLTFVSKYAPSSGGCDENISIYYAEINIEFNDLIKFQDKITGNKYENESIKLDIVPFDKISNYGVKANIALDAYIKNKD